MPRDGHEPTAISIAHSEETGLGYRVVIVGLLGTGEFILSILTSCQNPRST